VVAAPIEITVAICTWNRSQLLEQTLERMADALVVPPDLEWEIVVIDNGSTDATPRVIDRFRGRLPLRSAEEPERGLSRARNRAIAEAKGRHIVWTDDDVLVEPGWLAAYREAFRRHPEASVFGGVIEPWSAGEMPAWLRAAWPEFRSAYAARDLGPAEIRLTPSILPYGANMAVRAEEQRQYLFDAELGHRGAGRLGGEETAVLRSILAGGGEGWWVPGARLRHFIPAERQSLGYLRAFYHGRGQRLHRDADGHPWTNWGRAGWYLQLGMAGLLSLLGRLSGRSALWARGFRRAWIARGYLDGPSGFETGSAAERRRPTAVEGVRP